MSRRFVDMRWIAQRMQFKDDRINRALARIAEKDHAMADRLTLATTAAAPIVSDEHLQLIRTTIAKDATPAELELFLYDNARQGVHPLDRLIHFTKRSGKYTPVTSIDFMRIRAADSGECAGIDDPVFAGTPKTAHFAATVTVHRLVQGTRYPFTATARWSEYRPDQAFMWDRMPHTMLGKCAEALALRKGFPKQLAGLYVKEEMEQAAPKSHPPAAPLGNGGQSPDRVGAVSVPRADAPPDIPETWQPFVEIHPITGRIVDVATESRAGKRSGSNYTKTTITLESGEELYTLDLGLGAAAIAHKEAGDRVTITSKPTGRGQELQTLTIATDTAF